jgi:hypothetical protein
VPDRSSFYVAHAFDVQFYSGSSYYCAAMPLSLLQSKLLRALQERKVRPVGGDSTFGAQSRRGQCASPNGRTCE